jgi:hypothetical protein
MTSFDHLGKNKFSTSAIHIIFRKNINVSEYNGGKKS